MDIHDNSSYPFLGRKLAFTFGQGQLLYFYCGLAATTYYDFCVRQICARHYTASRTCRLVPRDGRGVNADPIRISDAQENKCLILTSAANRRKMRRRSFASEGSRAGEAERTSAMRLSP